MGKLGISIYPEKASIEEMKEYLKSANKYGFNRLFLSFLQIDIKKPKKALEKYQLIMKEAKQLGFSVYVDFVPQMFGLFGESYKNLGFLSDMGVDGLRLDAGLSGKEEAEMTKNPYGIVIELNMSNYSHYLDQIMDYGPNIKQLSGCHNFFPQKYTGLSREQFTKYSVKYQQNHLNTATFVTSQSGEFGPWPLQEGLCTLEEHRDIPIDIQTMDLVQSRLIDDIIIGNMFASEEELELVSSVYNDSNKRIGVKVVEGITEFEQELLFEKTHNYRGDSSDYMIRSTRLRAKITDHPLPYRKSDHHEINIGDVLILNEEYEQYKGELQIALKKRPMDARINIVGKVPDNQLLLLNNLQRMEDFFFTKVADKHE
ncbi:DUF871 domain-containing protein [Desemzia sp. RIT804]|uniref:DUF871 domain-containing protein n=1 Tax=Desemzia sp. RIT 804 TaxID=2810209 RepID=UPI00194E95E2|nr:MupG family TIM beta-alpha barrel fold protein [Desemzia sp. RIT 804]MBM6614923.1 DUF871 domain-containing protein [Desemzia sp. RIT 804]